MHSGGMQQGRRVGGKWIIERQLGAGGMGAIFVAQHAEMGRRAALKCVLAEHVQRAGARERFEREAKIMARVSSPHVVQILDYGTDADTNDLFLVMELLEGEDLSKLLGRLGPLPPLLVARLLAQSLKGLIAAHDQGVVHRDIKPQNLFLARFSDGSLTLKVLDFGIGRVLESPGEEAQKKLTGTHGAIGSPPYMSPEQLRGSATVDPRTDLWSLGATGYELLAGVLPFSEATDFAELVRQIVFGSPAPLAPRAPWAPPELVSILGRCMQRDLSQRYPDARTMAADIDRLLRGADKITEAMLVPLSAAERASVAVPLHAPSGPGTAPITGAPGATFGAPPATSARGTAIMPASAMPPATSAPAATTSTAAGTAAVAAPAAPVTAALTTGAPVVTGAPVIAGAPQAAGSMRIGALVGAAIAIGVVGLGIGALALLSRGNSEPSPGSGEQPPPVAVADAGADAAPSTVADPVPPAVAEPKPAETAGATSAQPPPAAPPKVWGPKPSGPTKTKADDPFGTNRTGK